MTTTVETLKARWIAKRNKFIAEASKGRRVADAPKFCDGPDDYAKRELRAYRLAQVWARDTSLPGEWWWVTRDTRWDVYPQQEKPILMRVVRDGVWVEMYYPEGSKARVSYILHHRAAGPAPALESKAS